MTTIADIRACPSNDIVYHCAQGRLLGMSKAR
jgi:hypothetical protein